MQPGPVRLGLSTVVLALGGAFASAAPAAGAPPLSVARYGVYEQTLRWASQAANPWAQVSADVRLVSPSRKPYQIGGFYAAPGVWKFRFAPAELGRWSWRATVHEGSRTGLVSGRFLVRKSTSPGFVRQSAYNSSRWLFSSGAPYYPIGLNDVTNIRPTPLEALGYWGLDGGFRIGTKHTPGRLVDIDTYMRAYSAAGFNLFRWGPDNSSFALYQRIDPAGNVYSADGGAGADRLIQTLRRYGFRVEFVLFGNSPPFASSFDTSQIAAVKRYTKYIADRYGAYVDYWELTNEASASDAWTGQVAAYLEQVDPYHHPVGTNWSRPQLSAIQFGTDHWYQTEDVRESDVATWSRLRGEAARPLGKPTLVDEQGNRGLNWDLASATRLRLRSWTAFFAESALVFWNTSFIKNCCANGSLSVYLGPQERQYVHVLQTYTAGFDPRAGVAAASVSPSAAARAYALRGPRDYGLYLVATGDRARPTTGLTTTVDPTRPGSAIWTDPATGRIVDRTKLRAGRQTLAVPAFTTDLALKIT